MKKPGQIRMHEINPMGIVLPKKYHWNLLYHLYAVNEVRGELGEPMICTSGVRPKHQQLFIYAKINAERKALGLEEIPVPLESPHIIGSASDWADPEGRIYNFLTLERPELLEELDLYIEHRDYTPKHCHIQTVPFKSFKGGTKENRIFIPY